MDQEVISKIFNSNVRIKHLQEYNDKYRTLKVHDSAYYVREVLHDEEIVQYLDINGKILNSQVDRQLFELTDWLRENTTQRERDLIYIFETYQKAYFTYRNWVMEDLLHICNNIEFDYIQLLNVDKKVKQYNFPKRLHIIPCKKVALCDNEKDIFDDITIPFENMYLFDKVIPIVDLTNKSCDSDIFNTACDMNIIISFDNHKYCFKSHKDFIEQFIEF